MSTNGRLKIAYLCEIHPKHKWANSGGNTRIYNALKEHVGDVTVLSNSWGAVDFVRRLIEKMPLDICIRLKFRVHMLLSRFIARNVRKELAKDKYDVLFCTYGFFCLLNVKPPYPLVTVFTSDASYTAYKYSDVGEAFKSFLSVSRMLDPMFLKLEKRVYNNTDLLLWPSQWMVDAAKDVYQLPEDKSRLVNWGAGIASPAKEALALDNPIHDQVNLLLVGRDWFPKGGPVVLEVLKTLLSRGVNAHLTVVGCEVPEFHQHENMTMYRQLNKEVPEELETFTSLYRNSHFFVMPSFEAYGFAFCEAGAYGLPSLCLRVGGVPIVDGENGHAFPKGSKPEVFADQIQHYMQNPDEYRDLRERTRNYFEENLNWDAWGKKVSHLLHEKIDSTDS